MNYVDFGNTAVVGIDEMGEYDQQFDDIPYQAVLYRIGIDVEGLSSAMNDDLVRFLQANCLRKCCRLTVSENGLAAVRLGSGQFLMEAIQRRIIQSPVWNHNLISFLKFFFWKFFKFA